MKHLFSKTWSVAGNEYRRWIVQPRILTVGVLLILMYNLSILPLLERADKMGSPMNLLEPFVAVGNSGQLVMLIPFVFLILFSDYPRISANSLLYISRIGRIPWFLGQLLFLILAIMTFLSTLLLCSVLCCGIGTLSLSWSDAVTKYNSVFPNEYGSFASLLLPPNLYNQIPLYKAVILTFAYLFFYLLLLSLVLYLFQLLHLHTFGLFAAVFMISCGVLTCALHTKWMWLFPMAHTIPWLHYEEILKKPVFPFWITNVYWAVGIAAGIVCNILSVRKFEFYQMEE